MDPPEPSADLLLGQLRPSPQLAAYRDALPELAHATRRPGAALAFPAPDPDVTLQVRQKDGFVLQARPPLYARLDVKLFEAQMELRASLERASVLEHAALVAGGGEAWARFRAALPPLDALFRRLWELQALAAVEVRAAPSRLQRQASAEAAALAEKASRPGVAAAEALALHRQLEAAPPAPPRPTEASLLLVEREPYLRREAATELRRRRAVQRRTDKVADRVSAGASVRRAATRRRRAKKPA
jgi:hypothetical protein